MLKLGVAPPMSHSLSLALVALCAACLGVTTVHAQPATPPGPRAAPSEPAPPKEELPSGNPAEPPQKGDAILLKSGKTLSNVQVIRSTPSSIEVQVHAGVEPLVLPRSMVEEITLDNIDPNKRRRLKRRGEEQPGPDVIPAKKLSPEFYQMLTRPLAEEELRYLDRDYVETLTELSERAGVPLEFQPGVTNIPVENRRWTVSVQPGESLQTVLIDKFQSEFPDNSVDYDFNKIVVKRRPPSTPPPDRAEDTPPSPAPATTN